MKLLDTKLPECKLAIDRDKNLDDYAKARLFDILRTEYAKALQKQTNEKDPLRPPSVKGEQDRRKEQGYVQGVQEPFRR